MQPEPEEPAVDFVAPLAPVGDGVHDDTPADAVDDDGRPARPAAPARPHRPVVRQSRREPPPQTARSALIRDVFLGAVSALGVVVLVLVGAQPDAVRLHAASMESWVFAGFLILGQLRPVRAIRNHEGEEISTATTFAFALLLTLGTAPAAIAAGVASVIGSLSERKNHLRIVFDVATSALGVIAAGTVFDLAGGGIDLVDGEATPLLLVPLALAGAAFFVVQSGLSVTAFALERGMSPWRHLQHDFRFRVSTTVILVALSPVVVVVGYHGGLALLPLLLLPVAAVYQSARTSLEKEYQALHDPLTALPNRTLFYERSEAAIESARTSNRLLAVMLLDLDRFKEVNDTLGHHTGDVLLEEIASRVQEAVGPEATVARLGGDEFAVLLPAVADRLAATQTGDTILRAIERPVMVDEMALTIEGSIGVAIFPEHGDDIDTLMQRADVAMYDAKEHHRGCELYRAERDQYSRRRLALLGELRQAIEDGELGLFFQPQADLKTGEVRAFEALVRWHHPQHGLVLPSEFIPLAEHSGLIEALTHHVLNGALEQVDRWRTAGLEARVSVNLSIRSLYDPAFPSDVTRMLRSWRLEGECLQLEVTESTVMSDPMRAVRVLRELNELGIRVAIDDFGTGYSSLAYLRQLPVSEIKIDKSFVTAMAVDRDNALVVRSIVDLARSMQLETVAEGVESEESWAMLKDLGCDLAQGYLVSAPLTPEESTVWLSEHRARFAPKPVVPVTPDRSHLRPVI